MDARVAADAGRASQLDAGFDDGIGANLDVAVDDAALGKENGDALVHQLPALGQAHVLVDL